MLIQFNFKNVRSFRNEVTLDLTAIDLPDFSDRPVKVGNEKVLPVAAIYGPNAGGKSNIYQAFRYMTFCVLNSFQFGGDEEKFRRSRVSPFLFDADARNGESYFEVYFTEPLDPKEICYNYGFCIDQKGITEEWLNTKGKTAKEYQRIFYRSRRDNKLDLSGFPAAIRKSVGMMLDKEVLLISFGAKSKIQICIKVHEWFNANRFTNFGDPVTNVILSRSIPSDFVSDKSVQDNVVNYLNSFDDHIRGFDIKKRHKDSEEEEDRYKISTQHKMLDADEMAELSLHDESAGTQKMFSLYPYLQSVLQKGSVFFVDELNARLHPLLVRYILLMFLNPEFNKNHAQLVFTVHDTWLLSIHLLRRDEIWFVEKNAQGISSLYSLADFTDEDSDYTDENNWLTQPMDDQMKYLIGQFGAIPQLKEMDFGMFSKGEKKYDEKC